ncbi:MAG: 4-hydroxy-tetrahydrodipicolinate synthase [Clostridiales bacterium]|jgi:4-hydroxy-tetrahydrodipicolinate synthase|nr:4-hydroxy-tetrahydrodipicolinate synthase [Clostridiales bacterium]
MSIFLGSGVALVTPFKAGKIDFEAIGKLIDFHIENQTDAIIMCGTTGESATLSFDEKISLFKFAVEHAKGRIPIIAGTGGNNTAEVIRLSKAAQDTGVNGLLIVTPYYNKTTQQGLVAHFKAVADAVSIPIITYNVPSRTGLNILPQTMKEIAKHKNIVATKEASGNIEQIVALAALCPELDIYSGNDDHVLPVLSVGGKGVISTVANIIPADMHNVCQEYFNGNIEKSREIQFKMLPICRAAFAEVNPIPIKYMLALAGKVSEEYRLPLIPPADETKALIKGALKDYGII